jgi:hypothetical protein
MLKYGLTIGTGPMLRATQCLIRRMHPRNVALLSRYWQERRSDLVVSMIPNFNRAIFEGLRIADRERSRPATPMVTILTDLADCPPHFWIERQEQYLICGTATAAEQALAMGYPSGRVLRTSGMIVRPEFYRRSDIGREEGRRRLGLHPGLPTGLVMFGGFGSRRMQTIARRVAEAGVKPQLIFLCGHNQRLREQISAMKLPFPCHVEGFTREIPYFMHLADFLIGKPGPGEHQRGVGDGAAGDCRTQRPDHGTGALQYRVDRTSSVRSGAALVQRNRIGDQPDARPATLRALSLARRRAQ